jgi:hypothetical protein
VAVRNEEKCLKRGKVLGVMLVRVVMKVGKQRLATKKVSRYGMALFFNLIN